jgi:acyl-CoA thioesterase FadM
MGHTLMSLHCRYHSIDASIRCHHRLYIDSTPQTKDKKSNKCHQQILTNTNGKVRRDARAIDGIRVLVRF